MIYFGTRQRWK